MELEEAGGDEDHTVTFCCRPLSSVVVRCRPLSSVVVHMLPRIVKHRVMSPVTRSLMKHFPDVISVKSAEVKQSGALPLFMYDSSDYDKTSKLPANALFSYDTCDMSPTDFLKLCEGQHPKPERTHYQTAPLTSPQFVQVRWQEVGPSSIDRSAAPPSFGRAHCPTVSLTITATL